MLPWDPDENFGTSVRAWSRHCKLTDHQLQCSVVYFYQMSLKWWKMLKFENEQDFIYGILMESMFLLFKYILLSKIIVEPSYIYLLGIWLILAILNLIFQWNLMMPRHRATASKRVPVHRPRSFRFQGDQVI